MSQVTITLNEYRKLVASKEKVDSIRRYISKVENQSSPSSFLEISMVKVLVEESPSADFEESPSFECVMKKVLEDLLNQPYSEMSDEDEEAAESEDSGKG
jgi:hypothetical protein